MTDYGSCRVGAEFAARRTRSEDEVFACITCGDDGAEMTVLGLDAGPGLAWCTADDVTAAPELVEVSLLEAVAPGDHILVHAGTAIASLERPR